MSLESVFSGIIPKDPQYGGSSGGGGSSDPTANSSSVADHKLSRYLEHLHPFWHNRKPYSTNETWTPEVDVRETDSDFFFEVELAGVTDKDSVTVQWTSTRMLVIEGTVERPSLRDEWGVGGEPVTSKEGGIKAEGKGEEGAVDDATPAAAAAAEEEAKVTSTTTEAGKKTTTDKTKKPDSDSDSSTRLLVGERKVGHYRRVLSFPVDVDMPELRARLRDGLLKIKVPKKNLDDSSKIKIRVE